MITNSLIVYSHLVILAIMLSALWVVNLFLSSEHIPLVQIIIVACLYCGYSSLISILILRFWHGGRKQRTNSLLCYIFLLITVIPIVRILVHELLPRVGITFFDDSLPEDMPQFYFRILSGYFTANLLAVVVALVCGYINMRQEKKRLDQDLINYRDRAVGLKYTSHFLTSIFLTKFGDMLLNDAPKDKTTKRDIIQFLAYLMEVERPGGLRAWAEEMEHLNSFIRLLRRHYGENAILYSEVLHGGIFPAISTGILFFPLENCLKHALISAAYPVDYRLVVNQQEIVLTCQNYWSPKDELLKSETGFEMLRYKLGQMNTPTSMDINRTADTFFVRLQLNLDMNEKAEL